MTTDEEVALLFERADPARTDDVAPAPDAVRYLAALRARSTDVPMTELSPSPSTSTDRRHWTRRALAGVAAVAAIVVVAFLLTDRDDGDDRVAVSPASDGSTPVAVASAFLDAYGAFDVDRAAAHLAPDADVSGLEGGRQDWRLGNAWLAAEGFELLARPCTAVHTGSAGTMVRCPFDFHAIHSAEIGRGPYGGSSFELTVSGGRIVSAAVNWSYLTNGFSSEMWEPFARWVSEHHPADAAAMYTDPSHTLEQLTEASIRLWERRTREYVAVVGVDPASPLGVAESFMAAWAAGDGDTVAALLARAAPAGDRLTLGTVAVGFNASGPALRDPADLPALHDWYRAVGWELRRDRCHVVAGGASADVMCPYTYEHDLTRAAGRGPIAGVIGLSARGQGITHVADPRLFETDADLAFGFRAWVAEHHPEDVERMYVSTDELVPRLDPGSIARWERHVDEVVASGVELIRPRPDALTRAEYGARTRAICGAAAAAVWTEIARLGRSEWHLHPAVHEAVVRHSEAALDQLRALPIPEDERAHIERVLALVEEEIDLDRQLATAAAAGDTARVDELTGDRVDATHRKDGTGGRDFWSCPVALGA
jgi:hypothetical protein